MLEFYNFYENAGDFSYFSLCWRFQAQCGSLQQDAGGLATMHTGIPHYWDWDFEKNSDWKWDRDPPFRALYYVATIH